MNGSSGGAISLWQKLPKNVLKSVRQMLEPGFCLLSVFHHVARGYAAGCV